MASVTIRIKENGPYVVQGDVELVDSAGNVIPTVPGKNFSLCRCGGSTKKPFCDGTHSRIGFIAAQRAVAEAEGENEPLGG